jgi:hypothetical protein
MAMLKTTNAEINEAMDELEIAENHFNNADPQFLDSALLRLASAREKLNVLLKVYKAKSFAQ